MFNFNAFIVPTLDFYVQNTCLRDNLNKKILAFIFFHAIMKVFLVPYRLVECLSIRTCALDCHPKFIFVQLVFSTRCIQL